MRLRMLAALLVLAAAAFAWPDLNRPVVRAVDGKEHLAGQIIVELKPELRGAVRLAVEDGIARFGVPALDELGRKWRVNKIAPLMRHPQPGPIAERYGCDLQYLVQFDAGQDIAPVMADYAALAVVDHACPNGWMRLDEAPNDSLFSRQYHFTNLGAPFAWGVAKGRAGVVNCVLDDGVDWLHPDIEANLWINGPEDINGNGKFDSLWFPDGDLDGVDQDGNGYTDDVIGFDFVEGEPNPMPGGNDAHGTHTWGTTNAVTNNVSGVAGTTWNSRSMAYRCGGGGGISISPASTTACRPAPGRSRCPSAPPRRTSRWPMPVNSPGTPAASSSARPATTAANTSAIRPATTASRTSPPRVRTT